jgi:hypothetical protein
MLKIIRIVSLSIVITIGFASTAPMQKIGTRTAESSGGKPQTFFGCPLPIPNCIPEHFFDFKTCRCVPRP